MNLSLHADLAYRLKHVHKEKNSPIETNSSIALFLPGFAAWSVSTCAGAAAGAGSGVSDGGMLQVMLGLGFVLALIGGLAWLLRRFGAVQRGAASAIRVIGASAVGQRERVILLEVADTWLVIGVAPGHVTALHSMPKGEISENAAGPVADGVRFSAWLRRIIEKRHGEPHE